MTHPCHLLILSLILYALSGIGTASDLNDTLANVSVPVHLSEVIEVPDVQSILDNPTQYFGKTISLKAVVSKTYPGQMEFGVADRVGCSLCKDKIEKNSIIIWYAGTIPKYLDIVRITGKVIQEKNNGYHINASVVRW